MHGFTFYLKAMSVFSWDTKINVLFWKLCPVFVSFTISQNHRMCNSIQITIHPTAVFVGLNLLKAQNMWKCGSKHKKWDNEMGIIRSQ